MTAALPFISELMPLNRDRRDRVMHRFARRARLTQYDICKLHVVVDVTHTLRNGMPYIGGAMKPWPHGPVVPTTWWDTRTWATVAFAAAVTGTVESQPVQLASTNPSGNVFYFDAAPAPYASADEDFSSSALEAIEYAGSLVLNELRDWKASQAYFHGESSPPSAIGYAWRVARERQSSHINWFDIFDGAERFDGADVSLARAHAELWLPG